MKSVTPFLMFQGQAEEAMKFYTSIIEDSQITSITRYGPNEAGEEGSVMFAAFTLKGQPIMCMDSNVKHDFTFTPSFSLVLDCDSEEEIDRLYARLSENGQVLMPLDHYPFSRKFAWVNDRFGVSWQLKLS